MASKAYFLSDQSIPFSYAALQIIKQARLQSLTLASVLNFFKEKQLAQQTFPDDRFSDCDLTLFSDENFCLDLYLWSGNDTSIHDHNFSGAFYVLQGFNTQIRYDFIPEFSPTKESSITWGLLITAEQEPLPQGSVTCIALGSHFIHQVIRFTSQSATLCLRQQKTEATLLNAYLLPGAALPQIVLSPKEKLILRFVETQLLQNLSSSHFVTTLKIASEIEHSRLRKWLLNFYVRQYLNASFPRKLMSDFLKSYFFDLGESLDWHRLHDSIHTHANFIKNAAIVRQDFPISSG